MLLLSILVLFILSFGMTSTYFANFLHTPTYVYIDRRSMVRKPAYCDKEYILK